MPTQPTTSGIRDNYRRGLVGDFLKQKIQNGSRLSVVSAYFTIYAYAALKEALERIEHLDFLFGEPSFANRLDPSKTETKSFLIDADGLQLSNKLQQKRVAKECADWIERKVDIKTIKQSNLLHGKMYHVVTAGVEDAILGSSNFTLRGLGLANGGNNIELNLIVDGNRDRQELKQWFDELWGSPTLVKDVKQDVLNYLKQLYQNNAPEFIYYKTLFHIFEKFLGEAGKTDAELGKTSLFETEVWKKLFEFQKDGAKGAINKILRHNGCIIADSVGLGKTYEALAVIKYFELKNERVLVLCPKKLRDNWTVYRANSLLNPFISDRFRYDVLSHTDLSRESGYSGDTNLATLNWGNYDLIVIDESHNFRNNTPGKRDDAGNIIRKSRYQRLMDDIIKSGVRTKVLLVSATPVNNDLKEPNKKVLVFTAFADTATYLYESLLAWGTGELGLAMALVCGGGDTRATFGESAYDQILTNFSPRAKSRAKIPSMPQQGEIDLLIATDCISEGQNLQDCDYLINYDIHWNPVRIIQRFGRIDRIGSASHTVQLVNFWPTEDLNKYINLKNRVEARMALVDIAATFEDNVLKNEEIEDIISEDLRYRDKQLLRLKEEVLDLEDLGDSVSLTEFTLDDFRLELLKYIEANKAALEAAPLGLYTCVPPHPEYKVITPGVIFCFRQEGQRGGASEAKPGPSESINPLQPYFLIYVHDDGNVRFGFAHPKQILDIYRILCSGKAEACDPLCSLFDQQTNHGSDMKAYDKLLKRAVDSIVATFRKRVATGLQTGRSFKIPEQQDQASDTTDFELVTWLVIQRP